MRRASILAGLVTVLFWGTATPAWADPAAPTNYRSEVVALEPTVRAVEVEVVGGDAFLRISVEPGHDVVVPGYRDEPYLRIDEQGVVWRNTHSPATYLNDDRYAQVEVPATADPETEPEWEQVATQGTWAWHDHRIHWMSPDTPPQITGDTTQEVFTWQIPLIVDGEPVVAQGRLEWVPASNPVPPLAVGLVGLVPLALWRRRPQLSLALAASIAAAVALFVGWGQWAINPADARGLPVPLILPGVALGLGLTSLALFRRPSSTVDTLIVVAAIALLAWAITRLPTLWKPILPTLHPPLVDRAGVGWTLWAGAAIAALAFTARTNLFGHRD